MKTKKEQTIKDVLVRGVAEKLKIPKEKVDLVVLEQFREMNKAMASGCNSVEMSGFGVFYYLPVKARHYEKKIEQDIEDAKRQPIDDKTMLTLETLFSELRMIRNHLTHVTESKTNSRRLEKHNNKG